MTDPSGAVANDYRYDGYGNTLSINEFWGNPHRYGGHVGYYTSEAGFGSVLAGQRWYNPVLRRWLSRDPISYAGGENLYEYVAQNPVRYLDPTGLAPFYNGSDQKIPYKHERPRVPPPRIEWCLPGEFCNADGIYPPGFKEFPVKMPNNCAGYVSRCGSLKVWCIPFKDHKPERLTPEFFKKHADWPNPYGGE